MKPIRDIRAALRGVPGALVPFEPEWAGQGELQGSASEIWNPDGRERGARREDTLFPQKGKDVEDEVPGSSSVEELLEFAPPNEKELVEGLGGPAGLGEQLRARLLAKGVDGLGWYVSFHAEGVQWGIYVPVSAVAFVALEAFGALACDLSTKLRLGFRLIHQHELFHFAVDYATAQLELLSGKPCWKPARKLKGPGGYNLREEKLANAWMLRSFRRGSARLRVAGRLDAARAFLTRMPEGYRDAFKVQKASRFFPGVERLVRDYAAASRAFDKRLLRELDATRLLPFDPEIDWRACPLNIVQDGDRVGLPGFAIDLLRTIEAVAETERFRKELSKLGHQAAARWQATKRKLRDNAEIRGLDVKPFDDRGEPAWSVRLNDNVRAHLRRTPHPPGWEAYRVGNHKEMGHG